MNHHLSALVQEDFSFNEFTNSFRFSLPKHPSYEEEEGEIGIYDWINCFIDPWILDPYRIEFVNQIGRFISESDIPDAKIQEFFFLSMNVADQLITPHFFFNRPTFYPDRLKKHIKVPEIPRGRYFIKTLRPELRRMGDKIARRLKNGESRK